MKQLIFALSLFITFLTFPSAPTPHVSQAVGLDADVKSALAEARSSSDSKANDTSGIDAELQNFNPKDFAENKDISQIEVLKKLIAKGLDIDKPAPAEILRDQATLLHYSVQYNNTALRNFLIHNGANLDSEDIDGATPLYWAVSTYRRLDAATDLIKAGAAINKTILLDFFGSRNLAESPMAISLVAITTQETQDLIPNFAKPLQNLKIGLLYRAQYQSNLAQQLILLEKAIKIKEIAALIHRLAGRQMSFLEHVRPPENTSSKLVTQPTPNACCMCITM
jgi:hypothetical protein